MGNKFITGDEVANDIYKLIKKNAEKLPVEKQKLFIKTILKLLNKTIGQFPDD